MMILLMNMQNKAVMIVFCAVCMPALTFPFLGGDLSTAVFAADAPAAVQEVRNPFEGKPEAVTQGAKIFDERCTDCHADGTGGSGPDLTDDVWIYGGSDAAVFETISFGRKGGMPQWRTELSKDDIWKVIAYIRSIHRK